MMINFIYSPLPVRNGRASLSRVRPTLTFNSDYLRKVYIDSIDIIGDLIELRWNVIMDLTLKGQNSEQLICILYDAPNIKRLTIIDLKIISPLWGWR